MVSEGGADWPRRTGPDSPSRRRCVLTSILREPLPFALDRTLRRAGLSGRTMTIEYVAEILHLRDEQGRVATVDLHEVDRMRVGYYEAEGAPTYETSLWRSGAAEPVRLAPMRPLRDPRGYAALIREVSADLVRRRGIAALETGSSPSYWFSLIAMMVALVAAAFLAVLFLIIPEPGTAWWEPAAVMAFPVGMLALIVWRYVKVHRPRPIAGLADLDAHLPRMRRRGYFG